MSEATQKSLVFVIDDDLTHLELLHHILTGAGYDARTFPSGRAALAVLEQARPDLILLDVAMPEIDGYELCSRIKSNPATCQIPLIFISILDDPNSTIRAFERGAVDYIPKPFHVEEVLARVGVHVQLRASQAKLERTCAELRRTEALRDNLTSMLIHDLRSPLAGLYASLELFGREPGAAWTQTDSEMVRAAERTVMKLLEMVTSLLDVSRLEEGKMPLRMEWADLRRIADEAVQSVSVLAGGRKVRKEWNISDAQLVCDAEILQRVITNLLANAFKFTPELSEICLRILGHGTRIRFEVMDQGPGISPEQQARLFEKFVQVQTATACYSTGLGLTFCKLAVEAHGGDVGVISSPGSGSTFWFSVPRAGGPPPA